MNHNEIKCTNKNFYKNVIQKKTSYDNKIEFLNRFNFAYKNKVFYNLQNIFAMNYFFKEFPTNKNKIIDNFENFNKSNVGINEICQTNFGLKFSGNYIYNLYFNVTFSI